MGIKEIEDLVTNNGFAVAFGIVSLTLGVWYIRHLAKTTMIANEVLTKTVVNALEASREDGRFKDKTINNHISHLTEAISATNALMVAQVPKMDGGFDRVVEAIHGLQELMKDMLLRSCPLLNSPMIPLKPPEEKKS